MVDATHIQSNVLDQNGQRPPEVEYEIFYNGFEYPVQIDGPFEMQHLPGSNAPIYKGHEATQVHGAVMDVRDTIFPLKRSFERIRSKTVLIDEGDFEELVYNLIDYRQAVAQLRRVTGGNWSGWGFNINTAPDALVTNETFQIVELVNARLIERGLRSHWGY